MKKKLLYEVSIIRPFIIVLLVFYHSFAPWGGYWPETQCFMDNAIYKWLVLLVKGFRIETIALIAGYVYSYQFIDLNKKTDFIPFVKKKIKRLYLPCLFFGVIYYLMFYYEGTFYYLDFIYKVTNGAGHLWFLPMLCWCFIGMWCLIKFNPNKVYTFVLLAVLSLIPIPPLLLGIGRSFHFLFYFYAGYQLWIYKNYIIKMIGRIRYIVLLAGVYVLLVIISQYISSVPLNEYLFYKILKLSVLSVLKLFMSVIGILCLYLFVCRKTCKSNYNCSSFIIYLSSVCYGVYIFHQFVLKYLYYYTSFPCKLGLFLPWISFIFTIIISYLLTFVFLKNSFGRKLIG